MMQGVFRMSIPRIGGNVGMRILFATIVVLIVCAFGTAIQAADNSFAGLAAACESAKAEYRPLTPADLEAIKAELSAAVKRLDDRLTAADASGDLWRKYLHWNALQEELGRSGTPKREVLSEVYQQLSAGEEGLNLVWFVEVQRALRQYLKVSEDLENPKLQTVYTQNLDRLAGALKAYSAKPTTDDALVISESLRWLKSDRQAAALEQAVEQLFRQPNLYVDIDEAVIDASLSEHVEETAPIQDCILGTSICGTTHTIGQANAKLAESKHFAVIDTYLMATAYSDTVGRNGPVCIYSNGSTRIGAIKRLWIDENGLFSFPASSNAVTSTCISDIQSIKGRQLVERIAWKKAGKQLPKAEYVASRHAEVRVNERIDERADKSLEEANANFQKKIRRPLVEHKLFPEEVKLASDEQAMHVRSLQAGTSLVAAPGQPPEVEKADMTVRIHESMVNNYALDALGGMTIHQEQAEKATFADDGFKVTIHGAGYFKGDAPQPAMDVTAIYKIEKTAEGFKAVRQGDVQIFPPGFDVAGGQQLSARHQTIRHLLEKRFGKIFEPEIVPKGFVMKGKLEKAGKFEPTQFVCRDGWLVLAWKRVPVETK